MKLKLTHAEEMLRRARLLEPERAAQDLKSLIQDERFLAVIKLVDTERDFYVNDLSRSDLAERPGALASIGGRIVALTRVLEAFAEASEKPRRKK